MALRLQTLGACLSLLSIGSLASAQILATLTPCPACPPTATVAPITVTAQYQTVSTCTPSSTCQGCPATPACNAYQFVSTVITNGAATQTITATDQPVTLTQITTTLSIVSPCPTAGNGCTPTTSTQTYVENDTVPFNNLGPNAIPGYPGSGLCSNCGPDANGNSFQPVRVNRCVNGACSQYDQVLVSRAPTSASNQGAPTQGAPTQGAQFMQGLPQGTSLSISNGNINIPNSITNAQPPNNNPFIGFGTGSGLPAGGTISLPGGITISNGAISFSQGGSTGSFPFNTGNPNTGNPNTGNSNTGSNGGSTANGGIPGSNVIYGIGGGYANSIPGSPGSPSAGGNSAPVAAPQVQGSDLVGCYAGPGNFILSFSAGAMTNELCVSECTPAGYTYAATSINDCYCSNSLGGLKPLPASQCGMACPGNPGEQCGGTAAASRRMKRQSSVVFIVYVDEDAPPTSTSPTSSASTPDPSSDADVNPVEKREEDLRAGLVALDAVAIPLHSRHNFRSGGQLRKAKDARAEIMVKRDFGVRQPFQFV